MKTIVTNGKESGTSIPVEKTESTGTMPKRPRGRPRKHPVAPSTKPATAPVAEAEKRGSNVPDTVK